MPQEMKEIRGTVLSASATGLAAKGRCAEGKGRGGEAPAVQGGNVRDGHAPHGGDGRAEGSARMEGPGGFLRRSRQMIARIVALHGGRIQRGSSDGR
jgi:hypothetical protein